MQCSSKNMEDGSELKPKERKIKHKVDRKDMKQTGVQKEVAQDQSGWRMKTQCADPK